MSLSESDGQTKDVAKAAPTVPSGGIDFDSDEPLICPMDKQDGEACESCQ